MARLRAAIPCRECSGRGLVSTKTLDEQAAHAWVQCPTCQGAGKAAGPTLIRWPRVRGQGEIDPACDQCGQLAELWSFELAEDEFALCRGCLRKLRDAIEKVTTHAT